MLECGKTKMGCPTGQGQTRFQRGFLMAFAIIMISAILLAVINLIISHLVKNQLDQDILDKVILPSWLFAPEQVERTQYLVSLLVFPILCFAGWLLSNKLKAGNARLRAILYPVVAFAVTVGIGLWLYFALERTGFFYVKGFTFLTLGFYLMFLGVVYVEWKYSPKWLSVLLKFGTIGGGVFLLLAIFFMCLNTENDPQKYAYHFNAYFYSVVQVFGGKTLLIDLTNLYGNYPYFLQPIFKILGLDVIQLTAVMGVLLAGFFLILFFLINRLIRSRIIAICAFLAIPGTWLWFQSAVSYDPYFQYWPHRVLFPGLLLLVVWFYQKASGKAKWILYCFAFVISGMALLWNLETGVIVFGTWVLFLYYETLGQWTALHLRKTALAIGKHTLIASAVVILSFGSLYIYTFVRSGFFPDMSKYIENQSMFYGSGYMMIPMPLIHPWNLVVLTYMVGICISFNGLVKKMVGNFSEEDQGQLRRVNMIFAISIMGAGLFSYYQGRSHDNCLTVTLWSAFFLIAIYADSLLWYIRKDANKTSSIKYKASNIATGSLFLLLSIVLVCYAGGIVELFPKFAGRIQTQIQAVNQLNMGIDDSNSTGTCSAGNIHMDRFAAAAVGNVSQIMVKCTNDGSLKVALYSDSSGSPGSALNANNTSTAVVAGWNTISIPSTPVTAGTYYWIAFNSSPSCVGFAPSSGGTVLYKALDYSSSFPDTAGTGFNTTANCHCLTAGYGSTGGASEKLLSFPTYYTQNINFIREYFSPGDEVLILSEQQTIYYMESGTTNPVAIPGFVELFFKSDKQELVDYLLNGIALDKDKRRVPVRLIVSDDYKSTEYFQLINENYNIIDRVNDLTIFEKRVQ